MKGASDYIDAYVTYSENTLTIPVLQDTTDENVWSAYGAKKDDMLLLDVRQGAPGEIVEGWKSPNKIAPSTEDGLATLEAAIFFHLGL